MVRYLSADNICSEKRTVFREQEKLSFEEQLMSKDGYPSMFSRKMEAIVFIILQIFFVTRAVLKIGEYSRIFPSFCRGIFGHVTCLDQSRASENISWITKQNIQEKLTGERRGNCQRSFGGDVAEWLRARGPSTLPLSGFDLGSRPRECIVNWSASH